MVTVQGLAKAAKNVLLAPWRVALWAWFGLMRLVLYASIGITLFGLVVMGHGLWHMSHPLDDPRFKGLTYWQVLEWEKMVTDRQAAAWDGAQCVALTAGVYVLLAYPSDAFRDILVLFREGPSEYIQFVDRDWEKQALGRYTIPPVWAGACYLHYSAFPTPEEFVQAREEYRAWKKAQETVKSP